ncbi:hypothetical protein [Azospirillum argentinense]
MLLRCSTDLKGGDPMSHGAKPVAVLFGLAALLTAGVASADCSSSHSASAGTQKPASDTVATGDRASGSTRG